MTTDVILIIAPVPDVLLDRLATVWTVQRLYEQDDPQAFLAATGESISAVVTRGDIGVHNELLRRLPNTGLIAIFGVGTDAIDLNYTRKKTLPSPLPLVSWLAQPMKRAKK